MHRIPKSPTSTRRILPNLDLTPFADVAWLLLVFFILRSHIISPDKHPIDMPAASFNGYDSGSYTDLRVRIQSDGHIWIWLTPDLRAQIIQQRIPRQANARTIAFWNEIGTAYDFGFGPTAALTTTDAILQAQKEGVTQVQDIADWGRWVKSIRPNARFSIQADRNTPYPIIEKVFSAFQQVHVNRFSLITQLEREEDEG